MDRCGCDPLLNISGKLGDGRIVNVSAAQKSGVGPQPAEYFSDRFVLPDRPGERGPRALPRRHLGQTALEGLLEGRAIGIGLRQVARDLR